MTRIALAALFALAACAETKAPDPNPAEDGGAYNMIDPTVEPVAGEPLPPEGGEWSQGSVEGRDALLYGAPGGDPIFAMFCDERQGIVLERRGLTPTGPYRMMEVAIGNDRATLAVNEPVDSERPVLRATIPFNSELNTRLRTPGEPISVTVGRSQPLMLPSTPQVAELAVSCTTAME